MEYCKYCKSEDLEKINNYEYQFEEDEVEIINIVKCNICNCIHKIVDEKVEFFEFDTKDVIIHNNSGNWKI